jgi:hypothetical protein
MTMIPEGLVKILSEIITFKNLRSNKLADE